MHFDEALAADHPFVADRASALDALRLLARFGPKAAREAARKADGFRDRGNVVNFCRWRQVARLCAAMSEANGEQTRH